MTFGQSTGPPATGRQVQELLELLQQAGHRDFKDARGPLRFSQRQAGGRFTREEAEAFIDQLRADAEGAPPSVAPAPPTRRSATEKLLANVTDQQLAAELQLRGWIVMEP
jgi:hypothetical protein